MAAALETPNDYDLQEAWTRVCQDFAKTTKVDLTVAPKYSVDDVLEQIRTRQEEDNEKGARYKEVKDFVDKTIAFIGILGGIIAQGASMVFAPSSLCFNALSYLITTGAKYKKIFTGLSELFRRICDVLDRLRIYMELSKESVHIALRKILNEQLLCFVDICALSIKVLQGHRVLLALKVFAFSGDEGVSSQLARLETLVEREAQMRATLGFASQKASEKRIVENLERTKTIDTAVNKLLDADRKRDAYAQATQTLDELDAVLNKPSEDWARTQARFKNIMNQRIPGTGEWILEHRSYKLWAWATMEDEPYVALAIEGGEGCGKSFLLASIIHDLKETHVKKEGVTIPSVAYHSFDQPSEGNSLAQALKALAWQLAKSNIVYCKDLSTIEMSNGNDTKALWNSLFEKSYQSDLTFFLLLDGIGHLTNHEIGALIDLMRHLSMNHWGCEKFRLRILLSGRVESKNRFAEGMFEAHGIFVPEENGQDLQKFIEHRISRMDSLNGSSEDVITIRGEVLENLKASTNVDFVATGLLLDEISKKQRPSEIRTILAQSGSNREEIIGKKIQQLNATLSENDINDLNEILTWLIFAGTPLTLAHLEEVLFLKNGERSLKPLSTSIIDQYSSLICIEGKPKATGAEYPSDSCVLLVSDSIKDIILRTESRKAGEETKKENQVKTVNESEVRIVRRFLESVCDASLFDRFGFDVFFEEKLEKSPAKLFVDRDEAHFRILKICVEVICSLKNSVLCEYAIKFFARHLEHVDLALVHPNDKEALGPNLVALFYNAKVINHWWSYQWPTTDDFSEAKQRKEWFYKDTYTGYIMRWLQDSAVTRNLEDEQFRWVRGLTSNSELGSDILERIAQEMASLWLQTSYEFLIRDLYFPLVYGCFMKIENRKDPTKHRPIRDPDSDDIEASQILETASWAVRKFSGRDSLTPEETYSLGATLATYGKQDESIDQLKVAASLISDNWNIEWDLAKAYAAREEYPSAIQLIEGVIERTIASDKPPKRGAKRLIPAMKRNLAFWYEEAGHDDQALEIYQGLIEDVPTKYWPIRKVLDVFSKKKDVERALDLLQSLKDSPDEWAGFDRRTTTFIQLSDDDLFHDILLALSSDSRLLDVIRTAYREAIAAAETKYIETQASEATDESSDDYGYTDRDSKIGFALSRKLSLMSYHAAHCYADPTANTNGRRQAIEDWENVLNAGSEANCDIMQLNLALLVTREKLVKSYLTEAQRDPERSSSYLDKLEQYAKVEVPKDLTHHLKRETAQLLAQYHTLHGDKSKAKSILRPYLKVDLDILCDDDPLNDWEGYKCLSSHFWAIEEFDSAIAAWSLITPHPEYTNSGKLKGPLDLRCAGGCETRWTYADNFYLCATCKDCQYDQACLDKMRSGTSEVAGCDKDHEMVYIPAYDPVERATVGEGNVRVGGEIMSVEAWIRLIRKDWRLDS